MNATKLSFEQAKAMYVHRYTMEYIPAWARKANAATGLFYAPQYRTDKEWYANTVFPPHSGDKDHCQSANPSWPCGQWLGAPFGRQVLALQ